MNDLIIPTKELEKLYPTLPGSLKKTYQVLKSIESFEDVERIFLKGAGLSINTYRNYLEAVKQFYKYTKNKLPTQCTPADIECFYDSLIEKGVDRNTARLRIAGLKKYFEGVKKVIPYYESPFDIMSEKLTHKLNRTKKGNRTKKSLSPAEMKRVLSWLSEDKTELGLENYAIVFMLSTSGLRASELAQLSWKNIECFEDRFTANFIGKGGKEAEQELYEPALRACTDYFKKAFKRIPKPENHLFYTVPSYSRERRRPLVLRHTIWKRIRTIGEAARKEGIIKRDLGFSPHLFRRSYATGLYKSGMGIKAIQVKTRHASVDTLMKHYIHDDEPASKYLDLMLA
jgi:integrase